MAGRPAESKLFMETLLDQLEERQRVDRGSTLSRVSLLASDSSFARTSSIGDSEDAFLAAASSLLEKAGPRQQGGSWYEAGSSRDIFDCESGVLSCDATSAPPRAAKPPTHHRRKSLPHASPSSTPSRRNWADGNLQSGSSRSHMSATPPLSMVHQDMDSSGSDREVSSGRSMLVNDNNVGAEAPQLSPEGMATRKITSPAATSTHSRTPSATAITSPEATSTRSRTPPATATGSRTPPMAAPAGSATFEAAASSDGLFYEGRDTEATASVTSQPPVTITPKQAPATSSRASQKPLLSGTKDAAATSSTTFEQGAPTTPRTPSRTPKQAPATSSRASQKPLLSGTKDAAATSSTTFEQGAPTTPMTPSRTPKQASATSSRASQDPLLSGTKDAAATSSTTSEQQAAPTTSRTPKEAAATSSRTSEVVEPPREVPERAPPPGYPGWIDNVPAEMGEISMMFDAARRKYRDGSLEAFPSFQSAVERPAEVATPEAEPPRKMFTIRRRVTFEKGSKENSTRERGTRGPKEAASRKQNPGCCVIL